MEVDNFIQLHSFLLFHVQVAVALTTHQTPSCLDSYRIDHLFYSPTLGFIIMSRSVLQSLQMLS